jgi:hypothetical protein
MSKDNLKYPIYIISKGRWETRLTAKALDLINQPYHIVIEPQEYDQYAAVINPNKIKVLPFSNLGQGSIPARNWVWEDSMSRGFDKHWILDDNIKSFYRYHNNKRKQILSNIGFSCTEDLTDRYINVALSGMNYTMFTIPYHGKNASPLPPVYINTRVYSCILIRNDIPYRWRGRYNEDTDLSLRALKDGWCTILNNAFSCMKAATMKMKGGNTEDLYKLDGGKDGRYLMAKSLQDQHPDVTKITQKWGRWQHSVNYKPFAKNKLILKKGADLQGRDYKLVLKNR